MKHFQITLNTEAVMVLLRCLTYGESAISQHEHETGIGEMLIHNIGLIRARVCREVSEKHIAQYASEDATIDSKD